MMHNTYSNLENDFFNNQIMSIAKVTELAAIAAARYRGHGDEKIADKAAVDTMRKILNELPIKGKIVIGEGERDKAPMLYIGEIVGNKDLPLLDIALDPLEGTTLCANNQSNSLTVIALATKDSLLNAPDVYMEKIAIGPGYPKKTINIEASPIDNIISLAKEKNVTTDKISVCVMDRPRHKKLIKNIRSIGATIHLISDGDIAGIINTVKYKTTGIDIYMGIGGAPEGVLAASALKCIGGQIQGRLQLNTDEEIIRAEYMGIKDIKKIYSLEDMVKRNVLFCATGVTSGNLLSGILFNEKFIETNTIIMNSYTNKVHNIKTNYSI